MWHVPRFHHPDHSPGVHGGPPSTDSSSQPRNALLMLSSGVLLWNSWRCISRTHRLQQAGKLKNLREPLQTWEGEGGRPDPIVSGTSGVGDAPAAG